MWELFKRGWLGLRRYCSIYSFYRVLNRTLTIIKSEVKNCVYIANEKTLNKIVPPGFAMGKRFYCEDGFKYLDKGKIPRSTFG